MFEEESTMIPQEEGLFDDFVEDESDTPEAEEVTEEKPTETEEPPVQEEAVSTPFLEIKFNKETKNLTRDEARELAQKGMNYDRFYGELDQLAKMNGMNVGDYINSLRETQERFEVNKEARELSKQYPNADREVINELARRRVEEKRSEALKKEEESRAQTDEHMRQEIERQLEVFEKHFPDVDPNALDQKVIDYMGEGYTILEAYSLWKREEDGKQAKVDESKLRVSQKNEENRKRSLGNTSNVGNVEYDDFLSGFNSI